MGGDAYLQQPIYRSATQSCFWTVGGENPYIIRLYSMRFCPYAQRTRLVLHAKGIKFDTINIHLKNKPEWFLEKNPLGMVPTLETPAGEVIYESAITCEYLDEAYPEKKLLPSTPYGQARQRMMLEHFSKVELHFYKIPMRRLKGEDVSGLEAELKVSLTKLDEVNSNILLLLYFVLL
uniref:Glutathione S-transferase omega n=1 Tax=Poecilia reticulata TaxID=8081 RepID=A0A3P9PDS3_POERE